jgi:hypothetical protein
MLVMSGAKKGSFTIRTSAVLFLLSAVLELASITSAVALLGGVREGMPAVIYHLVYSVLFLVLGAGLWLGRPWGYQAVLAGTLLYTLDKALLLLDPATLQAYLLQQLGGSRDLLQLVDEQWLRQMVMSMTLLIILCWWGFAWYIWRRRSYFYPQVR